MAGKIAEAYVDIFAKKERYDKSIKDVQTKTRRTVSELQKGWDQYSAQIRKAGMAISGMGLAAVGTFSGMIAHATKLGDQLDKMSLRTGVSVSELSKLGYAAKISGSDIQAVETSIRFLSRRMDEASQGVGVAVDAFGKLGISVTDSTGKLRPSVDMIKEVASKINDLGSESEITAVAMDIFGARSGPALLPLLKLGEDGIEALMARAEKLGIVMSKEAAEAAARFADRMTDLKESLSMTAVKIGTALLPILEPFVEKITEIAGKASDWISENKDLAEGLLKVSGVLAILMVSGGPLLMLSPTLLKIAASAKTASISLVGMKASLGALGLGLVTAGAGIWAYRRITKALKEPLDNLAIAHKENEKWLHTLQDTLEKIIGAMQVYEQTGDVTKATIADLGLSHKELSKALGQIIRPTTNAAQLIKSLDKSFMSASLAVTQFNKATEGTSDEVDKTAQALGDVNKELSRIDSKALSFLVLPPAAMEKLTLYHRTIEEIHEMIEGKGRKGLKSPFLSEAALTEIDKIKSAYYELTHTEKQLLDSQWIAEQNRLRDLGISEANQLKARFIHYSDYNKKRAELIDAETKLAMSAIVDLNKADIESHQKIMDRKEQLWELNIQHEEGIRQELGRSTEFFAAEQDKILASFIQMLTGMDSAWIEMLDRRDAATRKSVEDYNNTMDGMLEDLKTEGSGSSDSWLLPPEYSPPETQVIQKPYHTASGTVRDDDDDDVQQAPRRPGVSNKRYRPTLRLRGAISSNPTISMPAHPSLAPSALAPSSSVAAARGSGSIVIDNISISVQNDFPNANLENMSAADFSRVMNTKIVPAIRDAVRVGLLKDGF